MPFLFLIDVAEAAVQGAIFTESVHIFQSGFSKHLHHIKLLITNTHTDYMKGSILKHI